MQHLQPWEVLAPTAPHASVRCLLPLVGKSAWHKRHGGQSRGRTANQRDRREPSQQPAGGESQPLNEHAGRRGRRSRKKRPKPRVAGLRHGATFLRSVQLICALKRSHLSTLRPVSECRRPLPGNFTLDLLRSQEHSHLYINEAFLSCRVLAMRSRGYSMRPGRA